MQFLNSKLISSTTERETKHNQGKTAENQYQIGKQNKTNYLSVQTKLGQDTTSETNGSTMATTKSIMSSLLQSKWERKQHWKYLKNV